MLGIIVYSIGCFFVAAVLTFLYVITRPIQTRDEMRSWRVFIAVFGFVVMAPYGWAELATRYVGGEMKDAVAEGMAEAGIDGDLKYFKVISFNGKSSRLVAVAQEKAAWGGTERPIVAMTLAKGQDGWATESFRVVNSDSRNRDGWTFPPFF
jgi:hypothetical protein